MTDPPAPVPAREEPKSRYFRHVRGFYDGTRYVRCDGDVVTLVTAHGETRHQFATLDHCLQKARSGAWRELTAEEIDNERRASPEEPTLLQAARAFIRRHRGADEFGSLEIDSALDYIKALVLGNSNIYRRIQELEAQATRDAETIVKRTQERNDARDELEDIRRLVEKVCEVAAQHLSRAEQAEAQVLTITAALARLQESKA